MRPRTVRASAHAIVESDLHAYTIRSQILSFAVISSSLPS